MTRTRRRGGGSTPGLDPPLPGRPMTLGRGRHRALLGHTAEPGSRSGSGWRRPEAGGFSRLSLWGRDYQAARDEGLSDQRHPPAAGRPRPVGRRARPRLVVAPRSAPTIHIPPEHDQSASSRFGEQELFDVAESVGARSLNAVDVFGGPWSLDEAAAAFAGLCDRAADHGLLVHLEFLPWSRIPDLATAWQVVRAADRPNGGTHARRLALLPQRPRRRAPALHPGRVDPRRPAVRRARWRPKPDPLHATLHERLLPGDGELALCHPAGRPARDRHDSTDRRRGVLRRPPCPRPEEAGRMAGASLRRLSTRTEGRWQPSQLRQADRLRPGRRSRG